MPWLERDRRGRERVPERAIRAFAARVAARYRPLWIILFGSYARGDYNRDSDVDLLVVTQKRRRGDLDVRIRNRIACNFPLDLLVMDEERLRRRIELSDFFLGEIVSEGRVLYEAGDAGVGGEGRGGLRRRYSPAAPA